MSLDDYVKVHMARLTIPLTVHSCFLNELTKVNDLNGRNEDSNEPGCERNRQERQMNLNHRWAVSRNVY